MMIHKEVDISVIMPIYNGAEWLDESITSVLEQTFQNFELILVNDESKDDSLDILKNMHKRIIVCVCLITKIKVLVKA